MRVGFRTAKGPAAPGAEGEDKETSGPARDSRQSLAHVGRSADVYDVRDTQAALEKPVLAKMQEIDRKMLP